MTLTKNGTNNFHKKWKLSNTTLVWMSVWCRSVNSCIYNILNLCMCNDLHLHLYCCHIYIYIYTHTYTSMSKCFEVCKYTYYIPLMTMPSCNFILISCDTSKAQMFWFYFFCNGPFGWPITKTIWNSPSPSKNHIVLHCKPYKCICLTLTLFHMFT